MILDSGINTEVVVAGEGLIEIQLCRQLAAYAGYTPKSQAVVELGAFKGRSTGWLAMGAQEGNGAHVFSVDPWELGEETPDEYNVTAKTIAEYRLSDTRLSYEAHLDNSGARPYVTPIQAKGADAGEMWLGANVGLLFHDALHREEDVYEDLLSWLPHMAEVSTVVLHDIGETRFGVEAGAELVFEGLDDWDWAGRSIHPWAKNPAKRGYMVVHRNGGLSE